MLEHGEKLLGAVAAWRISWESGMPEKRLRQFYVHVELTVPGQRAERVGKLFFHLDVDANVIGAGLRFPWLSEDPSPRMSDALPCRALSNELAGGLFNVVVELQRGNGLDLSARPRGHRGRAHAHWLAYDRERYPDMEALSRAAGAGAHPRRACSGDTGNGFGALTRAAVRC